MMLGGTALVEPNPAGRREHHPRPPREATRFGDADPSLPMVPSSTTGAGLDTEETRVVRSPGCLDFPA